MADQVTDEERQLVESQLQGFTPEQRQSFLATLERITVAVVRRERESWEQRARAELENEWIRRQEELMHQAEATQTETSASTEPERKRK